MSLMKTGTEFTRTSPSIPIAVATVFPVVSAIFSVFVVLSASGTALAQEVVSASPDVMIDLGASVIAADEESEAGEVALMDHSFKHG